MGLHSDCETVEQWVAKLEESTTEKLEVFQYIGIGTNAGLHGYYETVEQWVCWKCESVRGKIVRVFFRLIREKLWVL